MEIDVALVDICLPEYLGWGANIAIPALPGYTYAELVEAIYADWHGGDYGPDCEPYEALYAIKLCVGRMKERASTNDKAWSDKVWDFQSFYDDSGVYAYFNISGI